MASLFFWVGPPLLLVLAMMSEGIFRGLDANNLNITDLTSKELFQVVLATLAPSIFWSFVTFFTLFIVVATIEIVRNRFGGVYGDYMLSFYTYINMILLVSASSLEVFHDVIGIVLLVTMAVCLSVLLIGFAISSLRKSRSRKDYNLGIVLLLLVAFADVVVYDNLFGLAAIPNYVQVVMAFIGIIAFFFGLRSPAGG